MKKKFHANRIGMEFKYLNVSICVYSPIQSLSILKFLNQITMRVMMQVLMVFSVKQHSHL